MHLFEKKRILILILFIVFSFTLESCSNSDDEQLKVRIACFPNLNHSQALVGMGEGQFQEAFGEKNQIEWKIFNAGPAEMEALFAGEVDIGYIGPIPAINGYVKSGGEFQIIAGATDAGAILVSRKDLHIKDIMELDGKKIASPQFGNTQDLVLRHILNENGLKDTTKGGSVRIIQVENPDIKMLLDNADIDAALVPEPWGSRLIKEIDANVVLDYDQVYNQGRYSSALVIARTEFIEKHPDLVKKFIETHLQLTEYINENNDTVKKVLNDQIKKLTNNSIPDDILDASFERFVITNNPEKESISDFIKISKDVGFIEQEPDIEMLLNTNILNDVLKESGKSEIK
ncbi:MAG: aliphatic sulfonate ABC transporter substrate-binding protein [Clostridiales bacterium]|nr:aliphatic sulfonate ABC transporter substrate-binding protein [Clostridiales bacterium]MDU3243594.1 aliphatic sulfonate ABC transporter substrate-binding protein [Clostridiales bacterium]